MTAARITRPEELVDALDGIDLQTLRYEVSKLRAVRGWALRQIGADFAVGDQVRIAEDLAIGRSSGWWSYRDCLDVGATGTVTDIDFSTYPDGGRGRWYAEIILDAEWSYGYSDKRHWFGPATETPEGYEPPSAYDIGRYPEGNKHTFSIGVTKLRRVASEETEQSTERKLS